MQKGFAASKVVVLLAAGNLLSCAFQPVLAQLAAEARWHSVVLKSVLFLTEGNVTTV